MKAIVCTKYGPPEVLQLKEVETPVPRDTEVLIRVYGAAVNSTDPVFRKGDPFLSRFFTGLTKPKNGIPGDVLAGVIEAVGQEVKRFKKGDPVFGATGTGLGAHAEYICLPEDGALALKPANMTFGEAAALVDGALTALPFLRDKGRIRKGQDVLINGASGSVGTAAVQLAKYFGATVTGVCGPANGEMVRSLGAEKIMDYTKEDFTKSGGAYDIIFDSVAKSSFGRCRGLLKPSGIYLTTFPSPAVLLKMLTGSKGGGKKAGFLAAGLRPPSEKAEDLDFLRGLVEEGKVKAVIDRTYPLGEIAEAHRYVETGHKRGNVVLSLEESL